LVPAGFSLIELLVVIAIAAILLGIGVPNFSRLVISNRLSTAANQFATQLQYARSEATRLRTAVGIQIAPSATAGSGDFGAGWRMFVDGNGDGLFTTGEQILRVGEVYEAPLTIRGVRPAYGDAIVFNANGAVTSGPGFVVVCYGTALTDGNEPRSRVIAINGMGRVRQGVDTNADAIPEHDSAAVSTCTP
jgi:type IV fimbrial biogenesis protein FimT